MAKNSVLSWSKTWISLPAQIKLHKNMNTLNMTSRTCFSIACKRETIAFSFIISKTIPHYFLLTDYICCHVFSLPLLCIPQPGARDFVTKVKQINNQSDFIWVSSFAGPSHLTIRSSVYIFKVEILVFSIFTMSTKLDPITYLET